MEKIRDCFGINSVCICVLPLQLSWLKIPPLLIMRGFLNHLLVNRIIRLIPDYAFLNEHHVPAIFCLSTSSLIASRTKSFSVKASSQDSLVERSVPVQISNQIPAVQVGALKKKKEKEGGFLSPP